MNATSANPSSTDNSTRCNHRFSNGMRCRLSGFAGQPFCPKHTQPAVPTQPDPAETAAALTADLDDFTSAAQLNDFLSRLLLLLAQDKISTRRAAVLTYITSQLLRTLPAIEKEDNGPHRFIFDAPRPDRDWPDPDPADRRSSEPQRPDLEPSLAAATSVLPAGKDAI